MELRDTNGNLIEIMFDMFAITSVFGDCYIQTLQQHFISEN